MTATRRRRRSLLPGALAIGLLLVAPWDGRILIGLASNPGLRAATTEHVVTDRNSGLAINGYDPVAYFVDGTAIAGIGEFEHRFAGVVWRFRNHGNRAAFAADPDIYMPRFGGYDPVAAARGVAVAGDPRFWLMAGERLYLFQLLQSLDAFAADPETIIATAEEKWPKVLLTLSP
jgi:hypothetical protein